MMSLITPDELQLYLLNQKSIERIDLKDFALNAGLVAQIGRSLPGAEDRPHRDSGGRRRVGAALRILSENDLPRLKRSRELQDTS